MRRRVFRLWGPQLLLACMGLMTAAAYWPGLAGPLVFDDLANLDPLLSWLEGEIDWRGVVFGNHSGLLGRPVAMASFLANAWLSGDSVFALKLGNLLIHLACGALVYALAYRLSAIARTNRTPPARLALAVAALWLTHPIQASTVLYVVQRMAQLSALFLFAAALAYVVARDDLEHGRCARARLLLFVAFPVLALLATLSKENGLVAPLLCLAIEWARPASTRGRPREVWLFFVASILLPALLLVVWLAQTNAAIIRGGYELRDFSLGERLLTQARALFDYVSSIVLPSSARLGIYTDDYPASRTLLQPVSTLLAIGFWVLTVAAALLARRTLPMFAAGIAFFLAGHAVESGVLGLELYFEHRNYLPLFGLLLALTALADAASAAWSRHHRALPDASGVAGILVLVLLAMTHGQALTWSSAEALAQQGVAAHPGSIRAHADLAGVQIETGRPEAALATLDQLAHSASPEARRVGTLMSLATHCHVRGHADPRDLATLGDLATPRVTTMQAHAFEMLGGYVLAKRCGALDARGLAPVVHHYLHVSTQAEGLHLKWRLRHLRAKLLLETGDTDGGLAELETAWRNGGAVATVGVDLITELIVTGRLDDARQRMVEARRRIARYDDATRQAISALEARIEQR